jgi:heptosyltransferase-2
MKRAPVTLICVVRDDAEGLKRLLANMYEYVAEIIVGIQESTDNTRSVAEEFNAKIVDLPAGLYIEQQFGELETLATHNLILNLDSDEILAHPERLVNVAAIDADVWWFDRVDYINGHRATIHTRDRLLRMWRKGVLTWERKLHTYPQSPPNARHTEVVECWIEHRRTFKQICKRNRQYSVEARKTNDDRAIAMQNAFYKRVVELNDRILWGNFPHRILCSYNGVVGIGDTLMTTPALRALRKQYPKAHITYLTQQGAVLYNNPNIDLIDPTPPNRWNPEWERHFDIVIHWETSLTGEAGKRVNGYECSAYWAQLDVDDYKPDWFVTEQEAEAAKAFVKANVRTPKFVGMCLTASALHRTWQHSEAFVRTLMQEYPDVTLIFFGDARAQILEMQYDARQVARVVNDWGVVQIVHPQYNGPGAERIIRSSGRTSIREVAALMPHLDLLITPDSGLMHIACAFETPCVAYFNLVPPELRVKHFKNVTPVVANYPCSPCFVHGQMMCGLTTDKGAPCLDTITVDMMMEAVENILGSTTP